MNGTYNPSDPYGAADGVQIPSAATCKLSLFRNDMQLSTASGFLTEGKDSKGKDSWFLVSALHNLSGRDFFTKECLHPQLATPNKFRATIMIGQSGNALKRFEMRGELFSNGEPMFLFDWTGDGGDIAVFKIPKEPGQPRLITMNDTASQNWTVFAGLDVFALGYPSALDVNGTPIWKKISIASEPSQKVNGCNATLTDGLTYKGMSGGPVIANQTQGFTDDKTYLIGLELSIKVIGVYGGRFNADGEKSGTLGFYWPIETVNAIIADERQVGDIDCG